MKAKTLLPIMIGSGTGITLLTGLIPNTKPGQVGATNYGFPFAWLIKLIIAPQYFPWQANMLNFAVDILIWTVIGIALFVLVKKLGLPRFASSKQRWLSR